jgi:DNA-binding MarR family transcriptional regulator
MPASVLTVANTDLPELGDHSHQPILLSLFQKMYWLDDALQDRFASLGFERLSRSDIFTILTVISGTKYATDIARKLGISRQAASLKLIDLEKRGLVVIENDPLDRRLKTISFSDQFKENAEICFQFMDEIVTGLEEQFGRRAVSQFRRVLESEWTFLNG